MLCQPSTSFSFCSGFTSHLLVPWLELLFHELGPVAQRLNVVLAIERILCERGLHGGVEFAEEDTIVAVEHIPSLASAMGEFKAVDIQRVFRTIAIGTTEGFIIDKLRGKQLSAVY